jgi:hypothetical protein
MTRAFLLFVSLPAAATLAVPPVQEVEPNQTRETATPAALAGGGAITGTTRGFDTTPDSLNDNTRDLWRITLTANPLTIQRHTLQLTTPGTQGHTGSVVGVQSTNGVIDPASLASLQSTSISTVPARYCAVYTLGNASPSFLYRVTGSSSSSSPYTVAVTSETITPAEAFACPLNAGPITVTTTGMTSLNTKLFLFDGDTLAPIDGAINDDAILAGGASTPQSTLTRTLPPGRYVLAIANGGTADNHLPVPDDHMSAQSIVYLTESPGLLVNGSSAATGSFSVQFTDGLGLKPITTLTKPGSYGIAFLRFSVAPYCGPADIGRQGGAVCHDGSLDNNDFVVFIDWFFQHDARADRGAVGGLPGTDLIFDNNDWIVFIDQFFTGCSG